MNESEVLNTIEEEVLSIVQKVDELIEERFISGEISNEKYVSICQQIRRFAIECRNILGLVNLITDKKC